MLLVGAGLTLRSLMRLERVDPGFNPGNVVTARLDLNWSKYNNDRTILRFADDLLARVRALPRVAQPAVANTFPLNGSASSYTAAFEIRERRTPPGHPAPRAQVRSVSPGYFGAVGIRLVRGRWFSGEPGDPLTFLGVSAVLFGVGLGACVARARRATQVQPSWPCDRFNRAVKAM